MNLNITVDASTVPPKTWDAFSKFFLFISRVLSIYEFSTDYRRCSFLHYYLRWDPEGEGV